MGNANEILLRYQQRFGDEEGRRYKSIEDQWSRLWLLWKDFDTLFRNGEQRAEILTKSASGFFWQFRTLAMNEMLLGLCRLMDRDKRTCSFPTFTKNIFSSDTVNVSLEDRDKILANQRDALQRTKFAKNWRDKRIAHIDMDISGVEEYDIAEIKSGIDAIHALIDSVQLAFFETQMLNHVVGPSGDASSLLYKLRDGLQFREEAFERARNGGPGAMNLRPKPLPND